MGRRRKARFAAAAVCLAMGLVASTLVRRSARGRVMPSPERETFLAERWERIRLARIELLAASDRVVR